MGSSEWCCLLFVCVGVCLSVMVSELWVFGVYRFCADVSLWDYFFFCGQWVWFAVVFDCLDICLWVMVVVVSVFVWDDSCVWFVCFLPDVGILKYVFRCLSSLCVCSCIYFTFFCRNQRSFYKWISLIPSISLYYHYSLPYPPDYHETTDQFQSTMNQFHNTMST